MAGSRPLTETEERNLLRVVRGLAPDKRALLTAELFGGFRISETLSLRLGQVVDRHGQILGRISVRPACLKGRRGSTRSVPVGPELRRALEAWVRVLARQGDLRPDLPLFPSRQRGPAGEVRPLTRSAAEKFIKGVLLQVADGDRSGLSTHTLRKSWARRLYESSSHDLLAVRDGLCHSSVEVSQAYLSCLTRDRLDNLILAGDWTRGPRGIRPSAVSADRRTAPREPQRNPVCPVASTTDFLPGFES